MESQPRRSSRIEKAASGKPPKSRRLTAEEDDGIPGDLKESFAEVLCNITGCDICICGVKFGRDLPQGTQRVDCTCVEDIPYEKNDRCKNLLSKFAWLAQRIHQKRGQGANTVEIWVNCEHGQVRSVLTVGLFLMIYGGMGLEQAMGILRRSRGERWSRSPNAPKVEAWLQGYLDRRGEIQAERPEGYDDH